MSSSNAGLPPTGVSVGAVPVQLGEAVVQTHAALLALIKIGGLRFSWEMELLAPRPELRPYATPPSAAAAPYRWG